MGAEDKRNAIGGKHNGSGCEVDDQWHAMPACNVFVNDNFALRCPALFQGRLLTSLQANNPTADLMEAEFQPIRTVDAMHHLSEAARRMKDTPNAGGSSVISEVLSYELLKSYAHAQLDRTEMEVAYFPEGGSIVDYTCRVQAHTVGVSVTRAMKYQGQFGADDAVRLLSKKLCGLKRAAHNCLSGRWDKAVLHVWATSARVAAFVQHAYWDLLPAEMRNDALVLITVACGPKAVPIFYES